MLPLFVLTIFVSAALLFLVQPMIAKLLLPLLGGSPAVWNTSMVFFQAALLGGYLYTHLLTSRLRTARAQWLFHSVVLLVPLALLPVPDPRQWGIAADVAPTLWLLQALALSVGAPFFMLATTGPLLQRWFSWTGHRSARDPYFLYAASNAGSMLALLGYPALVEPLFPLAGQRVFFSGGYAVFALLTIGCGAFLLRRSAPDDSPRSRAERRAQKRRGIVSRPEETGPVPPISWRDRGLLVLLAFVPSSLMLGVTQHLSTDVAAVPLLWVVPLAIYLLTFILAFSGRPIVTPAIASRFLPWIAVVMAGALLGNAMRPMWALIGVHLGVLFLAAMLCHGRLAAMRPDPRRLTEFYLLIALGGVLGGAFNALAAPLLFDSIAEYPVALVLALFLRAPAGRPSRLPRAAGWAVDLALPFLVVGAFLGVRPLIESAGVVGGLLHTVLWVAPAVLLCVLAVPRRVGFATALGAVLFMHVTLLGNPSTTLHAERTFFGVHRVARDPQDRWRSLTHGTTEHGLQATFDPLARLPTKYYHPTGPVGDVFDALRRRESFERVAVVGLGAGALAAYGTPRQQFVFYEIDPAVVRIARDLGYFTYLRDARAHVEVVLGDARLRLVEAPEATYDLIVLDAFSSDAIPLHLVSLEAVRLYLDKLAPNGLLAFHVSNRYLELRAVLAGIAARLGLVAAERDEPDDQVPVEERSQGKAGSTWVVVARRVEDLGPVADDSRWMFMSANDRTPLWTDDFSNILSVFRWR